MNFRPNYLFCSYCAALWIADNVDFGTCVKFESPVFIKSFKTPFTVILCLCKLPEYYFLQAACVSCSSGICEAHCGHPNCISSCPQYNHKWTLLGHLHFPTVFLSVTRLLYSQCIFLCYFTSYAFAPTV